MSKVLIIGGSGFIGYFIVQTLLREGYLVTVGGRKRPPSGVFPENVAFKETDILSMNEEDYRKLFDGIETVILAAAADDRTLSKRPAYPFFHSHNVAPITKMAAAAKSVGVKKLIVLGSYFSWLDRTKPALNLSDFHPYIRSRKNQTQTALSTAEARFEVIVVEIPYVVGVAPHLVPLWKPLIQYINLPLPFYFYPSGGTAVITVQHLAKAIVWLNHHGKTGCYPLVDMNMTWKSFLQRLRKNPENPPIILSIPAGILKLMMYPVMFWLWITGKETGLHPVKFMNIQSANTYIDTDFSHTIFPENPAFVNEVFKEMVEKVLDKSS